MSLSATHRSFLPRYFCFVLVFVCGRPSSAQQPPVVVYAVPAGFTASSDYTVTVSSVNAAGVVQGAPYTAPVFDFTTGVSKAIQYEYSEFSFTGTVQVTIALRSPITGTPTISPAALNIPYAPLPAAGSNSITFSLSQSRYLIIQISGLPQLILTADPPDLTIPAVTSGSGVFNITTDEGVAPNGDASTAGVTTASFKKAIASASAYNSGGGGTVYVPQGVFYIDNIILLSNVHLYLEPGAVLRSSNNTAVMSNDFNISDQGLNGTWLISTGRAATSGISITGRGIIDGDGFNMRNAALSGANLLDTLIMANGSTNFTVDGITGWNAGFWGLMTARSNRVSITNYKGLNALRIPGATSNRTDMLEDDGIDINESSNVFVNHALVASADDNYSTKTWYAPASTQTSPLSLETYWVGGRTDLPIQNVLFSDVVGWSDEAAFKIGGGIDKPQTGVTFDHGYVYAAKRGLYFDAATGNAAAKDVVFQNIDIETTNTGNMNVVTPATESWANLENDQGAAITNVSYRNIVIRKSASTQPMFLTPSKNVAPRPDYISFANVVNGGLRLTGVNQLKNPAPAINDAAVAPYVVAGQIPAVGYDTSSPGTGGPQLEQTFDPLATLELADISNGRDSYAIGFNNVDFGAGVASVQLRVATNNTGGSVNVGFNQDAAPSATDTFTTSTGGWQSWRTDSLAITSSLSGLNSMLLSFANPVAGQTAANIDWIQVTFKNLLHLASHSSQQNVATVPCSDPGDTDCTSSLLFTNGGYASVESRTYPTTINTVYLRMTSQFSGTVSLRLDSATGPLVGQTGVPITVSPLASAGSKVQNWQTIAVPVSGLTGTHSLYIVASDGTTAPSVINLNSISY
jgi:hypothetical protein